jgi:RND family efflux transporter MFP subunit
MNAENDKSSLLDSLKIERSAPLRRRQGGPSPWLYAGIAVLVIAGAGAGWYFWPDNSIAVHAVTAQALGSGGATGTGLDASGYVVARRKATLATKILGKLTEVNFEEGQRVKAGDIVARLDDSNYSAALHQAEALAVQAKATLDNTAPLYNRYRAANEQGGISSYALETQRLAYENARTAYDVAVASVRFAQAAENDTVVLAPFDGIVTVKVAQVGEVVAPSGAGAGNTRTGIVTIVDMNSLEVDVDVSENYIERVQVAAPVTIHLDAYPDLDIPGSVIAIIPTADQSKGTVQVRVAIKAKDNRILPQMAARVAFLNMPEKGTSAAAAPRVSVPVGAVIANGKTGSVFVIGEGGKIEKRDVALGLKTATNVTILSGISAGERLAGDNLDKLHDGDHVKVAEGS